MHSGLFKAVSVSVTIIGTGGLLYKSLVHQVAAAEGGGGGMIEDNAEMSLERKFRVAVIGGGIGGASTCYFIRKLLGESVDIHVYEKNDRVGGRLSVLDVNGQDVECGGTYILKGNQYMVKFAEETDSETNDVLNDAKIRVWNGKSLINVPSPMKWMDLAKTALRYGPLNLWRLDSMASHVNNCFKRIYILQENGFAFETVQDMLTAMDDGNQNLFSLTRKSFEQATRDQNIGQSVVDELINPIIRWNLGQDADNVNGLTGFLIAGGGQDGPIWNFKDGNHQVCQKLLNLSKADVRYHSHVKNIERITPSTHRNDQQQRRRVEYRVHGENVDAGRSYDVVVVASPLEIPSSYVTCQSCEEWPKPSDLCGYQKRLTNFVESKLKAEYFNVVPDFEDIPDLILTTRDDHNQYDNIVRLYQTNGQKTSPAVHKVFSRKPLTKDQLSDMFDDQVKDYKVVSWLACPRFQPNEKFTPFKLDDGIFHVNAIERMKVGMECSAIGARNVALLASKYLKETSS